MLLFKVSTVNSWNPALMKKVWTNRLCSLSHFEETLSIDDSLLYGLETFGNAKLAQYLSISFSWKTTLPVGFGIRRFSSSRHMFTFHSTSISIESITQSSVSTMSISMSISQTTACHNCHIPPPLPLSCPIVVLH